MWRTRIKMDFRPVTRRDHPADGVGQALLWLFDRNVLVGVRHPSRPAIGLVVARRDSPVEAAIKMSAISIYAHGYPLAFVLKRMTPGALVPRLRRDGAAAATSTSWCSRSI